MRLVYTDEAIGDLKRLREFIAVHNPEAAGRVASELISKIELLPRFPRMGSAINRTPAPDTLRDMVFGNYVVRYSVHTETLIILRVWHTLENTRRG
jgi:plasmid stabilization system protein ParE